MDKLILPFLPLRIPPIKENMHFVRYFLGYTAS